MGMTTTETTATFTGSHFVEGAGTGDREHFSGKHLGTHAECPHCTLTCTFCAQTR